MGALKQAKIERDRNICADYTKMVVEEHRPSSMAITALCKKYKLSQCCVYTILRKG